MGSFQQNQSFSNNVEERIEYAKEKTFEVGKTSNSTGRSTKLKILTADLNQLSVCGRRWKDVAETKTRCAFSGVNPLLFPPVGTEYERFVFLKLWRRVDDYWLTCGLAILFLWIINILDPESVGYLPVPSQTSVIVVRIVRLKHFEDTPSGASELHSPKEKRSSWVIDSYSDSRNYHLYVFRLVRHSGSIKKKSVHRAAGDIYLFAWNRNYREAWLFTGLCRVFQKPTNRNSRSLGDLKFKMPTMWLSETQSEYADASRRREVREC